MNPGRRSNLKAAYLRRYGIAALLAVAVSLLLWILRAYLTAANFSLIYILIVLITAVRHGTGPSLVVAIISFLGFNFLLVQPFYTFVVADPREFLDLILFLLVAVISGQLASYARTQAEAARQRAAEQDVLVKLTSTFNQLSDSQEVYRVLRQVLVDDLGMEDIRVLPGIDPSPTSETLAYVLLKSSDQVFGTLVAGFGQSPTSWQQRMVTACAAQASTALQRIELTQRAQASYTFEEADRLKTALLQAVSHDLRTPLTIIKSSISNLLNLRKTLPQEAQLEMLQIIDQEADVLNQLVEDLLDMSRLKAGALYLNKHWNSLEEIAGDIAAQVWQRTGKERIRLTFPDDMPLIQCDYGLILRALSNLVDNALRYEPDDRQVELCGSADTDVVRLAVINHGPPIPPEERTVIMEPFHPGKDGHIGLGLAIAKGIIEAHQGSLSIEDTHGGGATLVCTLPRAAVPML